MTQHIPEHIDDDQPLPPIRDFASFEREDSSTAGTVATAETLSFVCDHEGCKSQPFKRRGDLTRHQLKHGTHGKLACPAQDCKRHGIRSFVRPDKLRDHILAGHDDDTICLCPDCGKSFTRDLFSVHHYQISVDPFFHLSDYRTCPLPRCSYKVHERHGIDTLQLHILNNHDLKGRARFSDVLLGRGYDFQSLEIICPMCGPNCRFPNHADLYHHFDQFHQHLPICRRHRNTSCPADCSRRYVYFRPGTSKSDSDDIRQHRLTILSLWPEFRHHFVFDDIKRCSRKI
ncbi:hypothetical protein BKA66DRAFT_458355 [Pyrenochaeta sp. MPI-SDFR-AT-0127]|nr:hypothetical protein BKA66DRAFT_458355 [Pyrenochaeta sp. MPI-SDFR-AT-0127]